MLKGATVSFDLDGTLIDTAADLAASMNHALAAADLAPVPVGEVRHLVGHGGRMMLMRGYELVAGRAADTVELDLAFDRFTEHYQENIAVSSTPFEGVVGLIERLRAERAAIAICTNKREALAARLIDALGLRAHFDVIVGADTAGVAKPDPAPVRLCLKATGAAHAAFIGDSDTDIRAAQAAGLPCLLATFGYGPVALRAQAAASFDAYDGAFEALLRSVLSAPAPFS